MSGLKLPIPGLRARIPEEAILLFLASKEIVHTKWLKYFHHFLGFCPFYFQAKVKKNSEDRDTY